MRIIVAPDSFKGTLSSQEVIEIVSKQAREVFGENTDIKKVPVADGGEGTVDAVLKAVGGRICSVKVMGPDRMPVEAAYGVIAEKTAVIEMAAASGLPLLKAGTVMQATTYGTGELISHALDSGIRDIILGIGGSATNDGGMGAMRALGVRFLDEYGSELFGAAEDLKRVVKIDVSGLNSAVKQADIRIMCDVTNPLCGISGATYIYGPQKGVTDEQRAVLDADMKSYGERVCSAVGLDCMDAPGAGAAGGLGFALISFLGAKLLPGIEMLLDLVGFDKLLEQADLVVTGEGRIDGQSVLYGKVPAGILKRAREKKVPTAILVGGMGQGAEAALDDGLCSIMTTVNGIMPMSEAAENAHEMAQLAARRMFMFIKMGMDIGLG